MPSGGIGDRLGKKERPTNMAGPSQTPVCKIYNSGNNYRHFAFLLYVLSERGFFRISNMISNRLP